jgi:hypothetical protein
MFHAVLFVSDGGYAFSLVDEPFEDVPEEGSDLVGAEWRLSPPQTELSTIRSAGGGPITSPQKR